MMTLQVNLSAHCVKGNLNGMFLPSPRRQNQQSQLLPHNWLAIDIQWAGLALSVVMLIILIMSLSAVYFTVAEGGGDDLEFKLTSFNDISRSGNVEEVKYSDLISEAEELKSVSPNSL